MLRVRCVHWLYIEAKGGAANPDQGVITAST